MSTISCYLTEGKLNFILFHDKHSLKYHPTRVLSTFSTHTTFFLYFYAMACMSKVTSVSTVPTMTSQQAVYIPGSYQNTTKNNRQESMPDIKKLLDCNSKFQRTSRSDLLNSFRFFFFSVTIVQYFI